MTSRSSYSITVGSCPGTNQPRLDRIMCMRQILSFRLVSARALMPDFTLHTAMTTTSATTTSTKTTKRARRLLSITWLGGVIFSFVSLLTKCVHTGNLRIRGTNNLSSKNTFSYGAGERRSEATRGWGRRRACRARASWHNCLFVFHFFAFCSRLIAGGERRVPGIVGRGWWISNSNISG